MRHLIDPFDFSKEETNRLLEVAASISEHPQMYEEIACKKRLATLFYEPSTRTRLSHEAAMWNLGGNVLGFPSANVSSVSKGETVQDTIRMVSYYAHIAAIRHPEAGAPALAARYSRIPVINAGDGGNNHPTQTLLDMLTIQRRLGRLENFTIGLCGDLKYGRTVHSLVKSLSRHAGIRYVFISPQELHMPRELLKDIPYIETADLDGVIGQLDILYMTRIQEERFPSREEYLKHKGVYILDAEKMKLAKEHMAVLHPFPRVDEIIDDVDSDPRAAYFDQAQNGVYVRMALIMALLHLEDPISHSYILDKE